MLSASIIYHNLRVKNGMQMKTTLNSTPKISQKISPPALRILNNVLGFFVCFFLFSLLFCFFVVVVVVGFVVVVGGFFFFCHSLSLRTMLSPCFDSVTIPSPNCPLPSTKIIDCWNSRLQNNNNK